MAIKRTIGVGLYVASLIFASGLAFGAGQYGPGVSDTEIKIGNTVPYSGPASAYGIAGKSSIAPDRRDDPKLGKMGADRIDHRGPLADEQMACAVKHQATLLLGGLGLNEPHVGPGDGFADGLCVSRIVLLPFDVGLHVSRWHQPHGVAKRLEFARPMMRRGAGLDAYQAWRELLEEREDIAPLQLTPEQYVTQRVDAVNLENRLGDVETDRRNRLHI
jgi:hypothetical protein